MTHGPEGSDLAVLLERYAYLRLQPDPAAMARIRVALVADAAAGRGSSGTGPRAARWSGVGAHGRAASMRRIALAFAAALALVVAVAGSALAGSRPGGPLYELRLWVETLTLPATAEARLVAELGRAELRLAEAVEASAAGDRGAVVASLGAYTRIVDNELGLPVGAPGRANAAEQIARHEAVLVALLDDVPTEALPAIEAAISHSDHAIDLLLPGGRGQPGDESTRTRPGAPGRATDDGESGRHPGNGDRTAPSSGTGSGRPDGMDERSTGNGNARRAGSTPEPTHRPRPKAPPERPAGPGASGGGGAGGSRAGGGNAANGAGTHSPPAAGTGGSSSGGAKDGGTGRSAKQSQALASTQPPPVVELARAASRPQPAAGATARPAARR
ncbi:MAG: hypothetical protein ACJ77N_11280 [Chloroflexota bacterium]